MAYSATLTSCKKIQTHGYTDTNDANTNVD